MNVMKFRLSCFRNSAEAIHLMADTELLGEHTVVAHKAVVLFTANSA